MDIPIQAVLCSPIRLQHRTLGCFPLGIPCWMHKRGRWGKERWQMKAGTLAELRGWGHPPHMPPLMSPLLAREDHPELG